MALKSKQTEIIEEEELPFPVPGVDETEEPKEAVVVVDQEKQLPDYAILNPEICPFSVAEFEVTRPASKVVTLPAARLSEEGVQRHAEKAAATNNMSSSLFFI